MPEIHVQYIRSGDLWYRVQRAGGAFVGATETEPIPAPEPVPAAGEDGIRRLSTAVPEPGEYFVSILDTIDGPAIDVLAAVAPVTGGTWGIGAAVGSP